MKHGQNSSPRRLFECTQVGFICFSGLFIEITSAIKVKQSGCGELSLSVTAVYTVNHKGSCKLSKSCWRKKCGNPDKGAHVNMQVSRHLQGVMEPFNCNG